MNIPYKIWRFYYEGFKSMTVGRTLWLIILLKVFIFFVVMKLLFFPDVLHRDYDSDEERAAHVRKELTEMNGHAAATFLTDIEYLIK